MIKTAEYIQFEEGFLKEAAANGCDTDFLRGYIDQADEIVNIWKEAFDELAEKSGDPLYKVKLANELIYFTMRLPELQKKAEEGFLSGMTRGGFGNAQSSVENFATEHSQSPGMMSNVMAWLAQTLRSNPNLLSGLTAGAGGGGLLGLLLGGALGHPGIGAMLGGLGGAGIGAYIGHQNMQSAGQGSAQAQPSGSSEVKPTVEPPVTSGAGAVKPPTTPVVPPPAQPAIKPSAAVVPPSITPATPATPAK